MKIVEFIGNNMMNRCFEDAVIGDIFQNWRKL